ncbi:MAG: hypothetical protein U9Q62_12020 [Campylobacterota bacterium]|nr:hypothetical protein [Campylobacterota bacterium]
MRYLMVLSLFLASIAVAESYHFSEERYISAFDKTIEREGVISFEPDGVTVNYQLPDKRSITYRQGDLQIIDADGTPMQPDSNVLSGIKIYFDMLLLLHDNDTTKLEKDFEILMQEDGYTLTPTSDLGRFVREISVKTEQGRIVTFTIGMTNGDAITIRNRDAIP